MQISLDPSGEPRRVLLALAAMLTTLANADAKLDPADRPDAGTDVKKSCEQRILPGGGELRPATDLAAAFGGTGNGAGLLGSVLSQPPALIDADSQTIQIPSSATAADSPAPDLAAAFGGNSAVPNGALGVPAPNAAPVPPANLLPPGAPAVPPNGGATAGASTQVETDIDGLPWNDKIHSSNKKKSADNRWMRRRNVSDDVRATVEAQLRAAMSVGNVQAPPAAAPPPPPSAIPTPPPLPPTTPGAAVSDSITLPMLLPRITTAMAAGHLTADTAAAIAMDLSGGKINNVAMLAIAPQLIPAFWARLDQLGIPQ